MIKKAIALVVPLGAAAAFLARRRKRSAAGHDVSPSELQRTDPPRADAVRSDADTATGAAAESSGATTDTLGASATDAGTPAPDSDAVMPDTGADDPLVREQTNAAAAEAAAIGGDVPDTPPTGEPDFATDPVTRPVEEGSGDSYEAFSERES